MSALLKNPETLETILATTPALARDPVALCKYHSWQQDFLDKCKENLHVQILHSNLTFFYLFNI
jgi:hypothetical protein